MVGGRSRPTAGPEDWEEFAEFAAGARRANGGRPAGALTVPDGSNYLDWHFQGMIWTSRGRLLPGVGADLHQKRRVARCGPLLAGAGQGREHRDLAEDANNQFAAGQRQPVCLQSTGSMGGRGWRPRSSSSGRRSCPAARGCPTGGAGLAIPDGIDDGRKENAMKLIAFLTNSENTVTFSQATGLHAGAQPDAVELLEGDGGR